MPDKPSYEELEKKVRELEKIQSQQKGIIDALTKHNENIQVIMECSPDVIYTKDLQGRYTLINKQFENLSGLKSEDVIGKTDFDLFELSVARKSTQNDKRVIETGFPLETEEIGPVHGEMHSFMSTKYPLLFKNGTVYGICGISKDITVYKQSEEALKESEERFKTVLENMADGVYVHDLQGKFCMVNRAACKATGYSEAELLQMTVDDIDPESTTRDDKSKIWGKLKNGAPCLFETTHQRKDGFTYPIELHLSQIVFSGQPFVLAISRDISRQKCVIKALEKSEAKYRRLAQTVPGWVFSLDSDLRITYVSKDVTSILGYTPEELLGKKPTDFMEPEEANRVKELYAFAFKNRTPVVELEGSNMSKDGRWVHLRSTAVPILNDNQEVIEYFGTVQDITTRKKAQLALQKSEAQFKAMFDSTSDIVFLKDKNLRYIKVNPAMERLFGEPASRLVGKTDWELFGKKTAEAIRENDALALAGEIQELEHNKEVNGVLHCFHVKKSPIYDADGNISGLCGISRDRTLQKKTEQALIESERRLRYILESSDNLIFVKDTNGIYLYYNGPSAYGMKTEDVVGKTSFDLFDEETASRLTSKEKKVLDTGKRLIKEETVNWMGKTLCFLDEINPIFDSEGNIIGTSHFSKNITKLKQAEEKIHRLQKAESLGRMAGAIAHHFNNMLAATIGNLEMVREELTPGMNIYDKIAQAEKAALRASEMSHFMLAYLGQKKAKSKLHNLSQIVKNSLEQLRPEIPDSVLLDIDLPFPGPVVNGNQAQLEQVIKALITNAWEAMRTNTPGRVTVSAKIVEANEINEENRFPVDWESQDNTYACLTVIDNGRGMNTEFTGKVFDPFFTDKFPDRGLGLAIALGNVKVHGGCITVESEPGKGSIFRIYLPLSMENAPRVEEKTENDSHAYSGSDTVLLVEDEEMIRKMTGLMLKRLGFKVLSAANGFEAVKIFTQNPNNIKLVLSDLTMPHMNGWKTLEALRKIRPDVPVILSSGYNEEQAMAEEQEEKPDSFLHKPYQLNTLKDTIKKVLKN